MNLVALQKEIEELTREFRLSGEAVEQQIMALRAEVERLKVDMAALLKFLQSQYPELPYTYEGIRRDAKLEEPGAGD